MSHHRNWMYRDNCNKLGYAEEFIKGVEHFLDFAFSHPECIADGMIRCPSTKCDFNIYKTRESVRMCLLNNGFVANYKKWSRHGESNIEMETDITEDEVNETWAGEMLREAAGPNCDPSNENPNTQSKIFYDLFESCNEPLWEGCDSYTKLTAVSHLLYLKSEYGIPNKGFDALLSFIKKMLPNDEKLPGSYYKCKTLMKGLGLPHEKIHACGNDCVLFWGKNKDLVVCPTCGDSRYKNLDNATLEKRKPIPKKVMHYFPLIPRLQRLFLSSKTAEHMRWHDSKRMDVEGEIRHPADGKAWKDFDHNYPDFAADSRNIRLGLATDGFNPFGHSSKPHSTWPVFIVPYNLPPWMCMKPAYMFMPLVIPGPKGPGRELDVFLEPLIEELKTLWYVRNHHPKWTSSDVWKALCDYWMTPQFSKASTLRKRNRSSIKNIPHTTGRVTHEEIALKLATRLGRAPTQIERFTETHIRKNKNKENNEKIWVSKDVENLQVTYANELREANGLDSAIPVNAVLHPGCDAVSDPGCKAWQVVVGGVQKGRLFGRPGEKWKKRSGCASSVDYAAYLSSQNSAEEIKKLREDQCATEKKLDQESKEKNELKAYITSMAPLWALMAEKCGMAPCPPPPFFINASSSTPSSDDMTSPFDENGENDAEIP